MQRLPVDDSRRAGINLQSLILRELPSFPKLQAEYHLTRGGE